MRRLLPDTSRRKGFVLMLRILLVFVAVPMENGLPPEQLWFLHVAMIFENRIFAFVPGVSFVSRLLLFAPSNKFA